MMKSGKAVLSTFAAGLMFCIPQLHSSVRAEDATTPSASTSTASCTIAGKQVEPVAVISAQLPVSIASSKQLTIATAGDGPPYTYTDGKGTLVGLEIDLGRAIGCTLGLKTEFKTVSFQGILTGIQANRYNMGMSTISDTTEREKVMNFVSYQTEGTALIVAKGNPHNIKALADACGLRVALTQGGITQQLVEKQNALCSKKMTVSPLPAAAAGYLAVRSGRADVFLDTFGTAVFTSDNAISDGNGLEVVPAKRYGVGYQAIALPKTDDGDKLTQVVANAVDHLIETGVYGALYEQRGLTQNELPHVAINDAKKYDGSFLDLN